MIKLKSYSQGISILLLILNILDLVNGSNLNSKSSSQGSINEIFCNKNLENLFSYISLKKESSSQLSSNHKPSDQTSSSSTTTIILPQGNKSVTPRFTITPSSSTIQRIDSDEKEIIPPIAAFADLLSFNWKYNTTIQHQMERLSGIQIFIFHHHNSHSDVTAINVNLNILLYSTQEINQPVVIMLSSFLPRKFYLSAISFLSHSHQPLHLILTHPQSEVVIMDEQLANTDQNKLDRLFISTIDLSKDRIFLFDEKLKEEDFIASVYSKITDTSIYKYGRFLGTNHNFVTKNNVLQNLWLFNNENLYSIHKPDMRIAAIYLLKKNSNFINLELGRLIKTDFLPKKDFFTNGCMNAKNLTDVITIFQKYGFDINKEKTCFYKIKYPSSTSSTSSSSSLSGLKEKYQTITWVHIESVKNILSEIEFVSSRQLKNNVNKKYLVILTGNYIRKSLIKFSSLYPKRIHILTNISLTQLGPLGGPESSLISLKSISNLTAKSLQPREIDNYLSMGSNGLMQTTIYKFTSNSKSIYRIRINVDDSNSVSYNTVLSRHCSYYSLNNISVSLSINANKLERITKWMPSEFQLGNGSCIFDKNLNGTFGITRQVTECSSHFQYPKYENKIYAIWKNKKYLLNLDMGDLSCRNNYPSSKPKIQKKPFVITTKLSSEDYIPKIKDGILISNKSDFWFSLVKPLQDKMVIFIQITSNINGDIGALNHIQLRDCYITNKRAKISDFKATNKNDESFKKIALVREGCFDNSSHWYSNMHRSFRPKRLYEENFVVYRFSVVVDTDIWASMLSLDDQYFYESQFKVHFYCGINKCYPDQSSVLSALPCRSESKQCGESQLPIDPIMKYYGPLLIVNHHKNVTLKISVLIVLIVVMILLLICLIVFFWRLKLFRSIPCHHFTVNKTLGHRQNVNCDVSFPNARKRSINLDYHSLALLASNHGKTSTVKLYSEPKILASLKYLVENCDKSLYLDAGYLTTNTHIKNQPQSLVTSTLKLMAGKKSRIQSHSALEMSLTEPNVSNWVLNSWPLSTAERKEKSQGQSNCYQQHQQFNQQPPSNMNFNQPSCQGHSSWLPSNTHSSGSSKQKISYTINSDLKSISNQKVSSNRTTVSESMSINEMPNKSSSSSSSKWWSLLTNYWMNQTFAISRN